MCGNPAHGRCPGALIFLDHRVPYLAGEKVSEARKRLAALERGREIAGDVRDKAIAGAKVVAGVECLNARFC